MLVAGVAVVLLAAGVLHAGWRAEFIPCTIDCGETYEAYIGALNLSRFGLTHAGGLQDFAASPDPRSHPTVYTHNPNIGVYFRYLLFRLGITDVHAQAVWSLVPFGLGLGYMYLVVRLVSGSGWLAALCLLNAALLYLLVVLWAFHGLRVFSWLLVFGPLYHLLRWGARSDGRWLHMAAAAVLLGLSIGLDYPFAVFSALNVVILSRLGVLRLRFGAAVGLVAVALGTPLVLRQIQVAAFMGTRFWLVDVGQSVLRRVPIARLLGGQVDDRPLAAKFASVNVLQWPSTVPFDPVGWVRTLRDVYVDVLGSWFGALLAFWVLVAVALVVVARGREDAGRPVERLGRLVLGTVVAQALTFVLFGGYFATFYGSALMPLLVHWIVPLFGLTTYVLLANVRRGVTVGAAHVPLGVLALALFVVLTLDREINVRLALPPAGYPGRDVLRELRGHSLVTFWISSAPSAYTHEWAARLHGERWRRIRPADLPFTPNRDYYFFFEADVNDPRYRMPEFLFVPAINVAWVVDRRCNPLHGRVVLPVDGCTDLDGVATRLSDLTRYRRGDDYLVYDLRPLYRRRAAAAGTPDGTVLGSR
jgi:hypothetical protein